MPRHYGGDLYCGQSQRKKYTGSLLGAGAVTAAPEEGEWQAWGGGAGQEATGWKMLGEWQRVRNAAKSEHLCMVLSVGPCIVPSLLYCALN